LVLFAVILTVSPPAARKVFCVSIRTELGWPDVLPEFIDTAPYQVVLPSAFRLFWGTSPAIFIDIEYVSLIELSVSVKVPETITTYTPDEEIVTTPLDRAQKLEDLRVDHPEEAPRTPVVV